MRVFALVFVFFASLGSLRAECDRGVVVLVHGLFQGQRSLRDAQEALNYVGLKTYTYEFPSIRGSIRSHGHCLASFVREVAAENPGQEINFLSFSLGALLLRVACNDPLFPESAKKSRAVFFAPPSSGSSFGRRYLNFGRLYRCLGFELGYELSTYTACDIVNLGPYPEEMEILIIAGSRGSRLFLKKANDGVIAVEETGIDHPFYFQTFHVSHYRILHFPPALNLARYFLLGAYTTECE